MEVENLPHQQTGTQGRAGQTGASQTRSPQGTTGSQPNDGFLSQKEILGLIAEVQRRPFEDEGQMFLNRNNAQRLLATQVSRIAQNNAIRSLISSRNRDEFAVWAFQVLERKLPGAIERSSPKNAFFVIDVSAFLATVPAFDAISKIENPTIPDNVGAIRTRDDRIPTTLSLMLDVETGGASYESDRTNVYEVVEQLGAEGRFVPTIGQTLSVLIQSPETVEENSVVAPGSQWFQGCVPMIERGATSLRPVGQSLEQTVETFTICSFGGHTGI